MGVPCRKTQLIALAFLLALAVFAIFIAPQTQKGERGAHSFQYATTTITIGSTKIVAQAADTPAKRGRGLSSRKALAPSTGMLFVFEESSTHGFWMKDMNFAIDIIWIDEAGKIVDIKERAAPETYPEVFRPEKPASYVLEVPVGLVGRNDITPGDKVYIH